MTKRRGGLGPLWTLVVVVFALCLILTGVGYIAIGSGR
jgi:hypothetical protein